ncbi:endonuclease MutS2 [Prochlorococcus sp. MIT 1307]|uniref:endonuclease MutS2 n=1 Tax=Prochlorococcus sp. MIT 1307 TaxID=3096219 RepID=UPI002A75C6D1|nr:endonuclease MutS2 [Prochlorococcus sp. MIT 1307]
MSSSGTGSHMSDTEKALKDTLELLEWPRLCEYLSKFASTSQGCRECKRLSLPLDVSASRQRLAETMEIGALDELIEGGLSFQGIHDLEDTLFHCFKGGVVSGEQLLEVAETLSSARRLRRQIDDPQVRPVLTTLLVDLATLPELEKLLKFGLEEGGRVADRASERLRDLRQKCQRLRLDRRAVLHELLRRNAPIFQDTAIGDRSGRPVLALKVGATDKLAGIVYGNSASGNTVFIEPHAVIPLGNKIASIETEICNEEHRLLTSWSKEVGENFSSLEHLGKVMLQMDLALARTRFGKWIGGVPPTLYEEFDSPFMFRDLRHPLLVCQQLNSQGPVVVPVSLEVGSTVRVVAITGPNTGGKTVTLKSVGLAVLMARSGLLLPCVESPSLPWCSQVLADIGDEQSLQQNLSTFSSHITRIGRILQAVEDVEGPSLVLLDEVGAGTDPSEGTALAIALLRNFADKARLTIATTHLGGLKSLKYSDSRFENASVGFNSETIQPTYRLQWGIPGRSNALDIARRLGLDSVVVKNAEDLMGPKGLEDVDNVIRGLEEQRQRQQIAAEEAAALLARTELLHDQLISQWQKQCLQSEEMQEFGRKKVENSIRKGQKEVRSLIRRLRDVGADGETARRVGQRLRQLENDYQPAIISGNSQDWAPQVGDQVRLLALGKAGEVIAISDDGLQLTILCGVFRSTVCLADVESLDGRKPRDVKTVVNVKPLSASGPNPSVRTSRNTLDVRGLRVHEAEVVVEQYLRTNFGPLWIIHGIGTGKLKRGLRQWLESLPYVERVADAEQRDGGTGCSVVWCK